MDTQEIVEKADRGDMDYVEHSFTSFTDFVAVFVRILIINTVINFLSFKILVMAPSLTTKTSIFPLFFVCS